MALVVKKIDRNHANMLRMFSDRRRQLEAELADLDGMRRQVLVDAAAALQVPADTEITYDAENVTVSYMEPQK